MAIVFEQPQPFNAALYYQAARDDRSESSDLRRQELALRQQQAMMEAQGDFARTAVAAGAQRANAGNMQFQSKLDMDRLQESQRQFDISEANEFAKQQQRAELQAWVGQQDMTYAEELRYQRDKNAVGFILADQTLTPWEKEELVLQRRTGIDMAEQRMRQTQTRRMEQLAQQEEQDTVRRNKVTSMLAEGGNAAAEMIYKEYDNGMVRRLKSLDQSGNPVYDWSEIPKPEKDKETDIHKLRQRAEQTMKDAYGPTWSEKPLAEQRQLIQEQIELYENEIGARAGRPPGPGGPAAPLGTPPPEAPAPPRAPAVEAWEPGKGRKPEHRAFEAAARETDKLIGDSPAPPAAKDAAREANKNRLRLVALRGGKANFSPHDAAEYAAMTRVITEVLAQTPAPPAAPRPDGRGLRIGQ
jgi:hypothetical protein